MNEPREVCMRRPDLCGEPLWREAVGTGTVDMAEVLRKMAGEPTPPPVPEPPQPPAPPVPPEFAPGWGALIRVKGIIGSSYWRIVNTPYAQLGDIIVVKNPQEVFVLRRVRKADRWLEPPDALYVSGHIERQFCVYGFVLQRSIELIAQLFRSGKYAIILGCDPRAVVKPPRRFELQQIWRYEGYVVNASPARIAVVRLDNSAKRKIALSYFKKGCPVYSLWANQLLQLIGVPVQLTC
ncbi:hypothetical protein [Pyrobaculum aerophilum]|uniref:Uncharacterized protein n=1 Tax=Pyrobaculum aerophilum TaxID=13773 RepID=A0A371QX77_9CREN|nr:hypothetical protein [Pyrobaculum aerophilum]RFA95037.1 hypothetical protein CGL51_08630 [Pyrobaculum aerophilum]RFA96748.1 hypothetical protein CGL52_10655 [Pyrobaculum aerophilum]